MSCHNNNQNISIRNYHLDFFDILSFFLKDVLPNNCLLSCLSSPTAPVRLFVWYDCRCWGVPAQTASCRICDSGVVAKGPDCVF